MQNMDPRWRKTLWLFVASLIVFPIAIVLTTSFTPTGKGLLHGAISFVFLLLLFNVWSSIKEVTVKKVLLSALWAVVFYFGLPFAIDLVAFLPISLKGIAHLLVIILFIVVFLWIWYDETKSPHYHEVRDEMKND